MSPFESSFKIPSRSPTHVDLSLPDVARHLVYYGLNQSGQGCGIEYKQQDTTVFAIMSYARAGFRILSGSIPFPTAVPAFGMDVGARCDNIMTKWLLQFSRSANRENE